MEKFIKICQITEIKDKPNKIYIDEFDMEVAVFYVNGNYYVVDNVCPHQHRSILCDGFIDEGFVYCPAHSWEFDLKTGKRKNGNKGINSYEVMIKDGFLYAKIIPKKFNW
ncbi:MAG TPA: Rieske 2Fe-2S domain-containing protein [Ignavibacteriales bacterium]|nr:Rieske 2Fe-2S domain-containing protein [Ignavibacteriales bacterium]HOL80425.1 Rieske 2Fe-2S domain-containing protein [Ignavibacteriales bacterium]HOM64876.1 Rieske 2Fe-2S domain-containing protein [Ignavibacteriales bacterium]HPD68081.1 Rieske 2Fe-2S domain-containing protein [Ignavibacteriales bacterium]HPP32614.1 Rieske 2Fe-2S domain-containing protein [Ignavibacteriales bacterium]